MLCSRVWPPHQSTCLNQPHTRITGMHYHTWLIHTYIFVQCHIYILTYVFLGIFKVFFFLWFTPLVTAHGRQRQVDLLSLRSVLFYRTNFRMARATQRNLAQKKILFVCMHVVCIGVSAHDCRCQRRLEV